MVVIRSREEGIVKGYGRGEVLSSDPNNNWYRGKQMRTFSCNEQQITLSDGSTLTFGNDKSDYSVCVMSLVRTDGSRDWANFTRNGPLINQGSNAAAGSNTDTETTAAIDASGQGVSAGETNVGT